MSDQHGEANGPGEGKGKSEGNGNGNGAGNDGSNYAGEGERTGDGRFGEASSGCIAALASKVIVAAASLEHQTMVAVVTSHQSHPAPPPAPCRQH